MVSKYKPRNYSERIFFPIVERILTIKYKREPTKGEYESYFDKKAKDDMALEKAKRGLSRSRGLEKTTEQIGIRA